MSAPLCWVCLLYINSDRHQLTLNLQVFYWIYLHPVPTARRSREEDVIRRSCTTALDRDAGSPAVLHVSSRRLEDARLPSQSERSLRCRRGRKTLEIRASGRSNGTTPSRISQYRVGCYSIRSVHIAPMEIHARDDLDH